MAELTLKQKLFIKEYLIDLNATQAAIRAGYSEKTAYSQGQRMLKKVEVKEAIDKSLTKRSDKLDLSAEYVLGSLKAVAERCMQAEPILDREGNETGEYRFDSSGANRSLELLGKYMKLFTDKVENENVNMSYEEYLKKVNDSDEY